MKKLEMKNGRVISTPENFEIVLTLLELFIYDRGRKSICVKTQKLPFHHNEVDQVRPINRIDTQRIQHYLGVTYGFTTFGRVFKNAVTEVAHQEEIHDE